MNTSEAEARGAMVMLNFDQFDGGINSIETNELDSIDTVTEAINGARITDPESSCESILRVGKINDNRCDANLPKYRI